VRGVLSLAAGRSLLAAPATTVREAVRLVHRCRRPSSPLWVCRMNADLMDVLDEREVSSDVVRAAADAIAGAWTDQPPAVVDLLVSLRDDLLEAADTIAEGERIEELTEERCRQLEAKGFRIVTAGQTGGFDDPEDPYRCQWDVTDYRTGDVIVAFWGTPDGFEAAWDQHPEWQQIDVIEAAAQRDLKDLEASL
jgi:hypothetical protein